MYLVDVINCVNRQMTSECHQSTLFQIIKKKKDLVLELLSLVVLLFLFQCYALEILHDS